VRRYIVKCDGGGGLDEKPSSHAHNPAKMIDAAFMDRACQQRPRPRCGSSTAALARLLAICNHPAIGGDQQDASPFA
jgi:hypothetical protein